MVQALIANKHDAQQALVKFFQGCESLGELFNGDRLL